MSDIYLILLIYFFLTYSFGIFSMGYLAGQQSLMKKFEGTRQKGKQLQRNQEKWLEEIRRN